MTAWDSEKTRAVDLHSQQSGEFAERYEALAADPYRSTFTYGRKKIEELIDETTAAMRPGARVLDVGCGTGFNLRRFRARGFEVAGVEPSPEMRALALKEDPSVDVRDGDIEALTFEDGSFDLVTAIEVIRYLRDPSKALRELARVCRPGGMVIVTAAPLLSLNGYALVNVVTSRLAIPSFARVRHSFMTAGGARRAMQDAGFSQVEVHGLFLGPWHALGRIAPAVVPRVLRALEPLDDVVSNRPIIRDLANHLVLIGRR